CYEQGLVNGITATTFGPKVNLTRAMMVTLLYRMEGTPAVTGTCQFTDVEPGAFYYDAVLWGQENGIVQGTSDTKFSPKMNITREQLITFLYRYAQQKGMDTSIAGDLTAFTDADRIQPYAKDAMVWAVGVRLIQGITETTLAPAGTALRSQAGPGLGQDAEDALLGQRGHAVCQCDVHVVSLPCGGGVYVRQRPDRGYPRQQRSECDKP
ncbi:MAG: S-layer homology domain-containing protein, partial [Clostridiales bacterium]|nr:S-layer homology domain-containing protein [Clostridiales bacterium]